MWLRRDLDSEVKRVGILLLFITMEQAIQGWKLWMDQVRGNMDPFEI